METSDVISLIAVAISILSFWYARRRHRHERTLAFEQRKQEARQLLIETDLCNQRIYYLIDKLGMSTQLSEKVLSLNEELTAGREETERLSKVQHAAFSRIGRSDSREARIQLEELFTKIQLNSGEVEKNLRIMESILEMTGHRITNR